MPLFRYTARTRTGRPEQGLLDAPTEDEAVTILQGRDLLITGLELTTQVAAGPASRSTRRTRGGRVTTTDLVTFGRALGTMVDSGLPLLKSLETMIPQVQSRQLRDATQEIIHDIRAGSTFRDAVAKHPKVFSKLWVGLIETGEASGQLTKALEQITIHLEKTGAVRRKVISAMIYPAVLISVSIGAIMIFTLKIIPTFGELFKSFGAQLPRITQTVLAVSNIIRATAPIWASAIALSGLLLWRYAKTAVGRWQIDGFLLRVPLIGQLVQGAAMAAFATGLGTMIKAGVPLLHGLEITIASSPNVRVAEVLEQMRAGAREGRPLVDAIRNSELFPPMVAQMIAVGEETGKLANMLDEIARFYEEQVGTLIDRMTTMLEPILLIVMGTIIGILVLSMYLPVFQLSSAIQG